MRPRSRADFAIAIICALPLEADAVEVLFEETYDRLGKFYGKQPGDANAYINGRIGNHDVVLCYMPRMGKGSAASVASSLRVSYTGVQLALVVGICGGVPSYPSASSNDTEIFLGDVIISDAVVEYDFGRQYPSGFQRKTDGHKDMLGGPDREIRTLLTGLKAIQARNNFQDEMLQQLYRFQKSDARWRRPDGLNDLLFEASYHHKHYSKDSSAMCRCFDGDSLDDICEEALENSCDSLGCDSNRVNRRRDGPNTTKISVHIGKVASADTVMKSGEHRDQIVRKERVIGFEMEGAGVWDNIPCIIIKGVCDYADSHKNKNWQDYAAASAACGLKVFLGYYKIEKNTPLLVEQDIQVSINHLSEQSRAAAIFLFLAFVYFRGMLLTLHTRLTRLINPWSELPAILEDAHLRHFTIPLDTINTWEIFDFILETHFVDMPGYRQVKTGGYVLEDSISSRQVKHTDAFKACFRPGRRVFMSMLFRLRQHEESTCPSCHAVNLGPGQSDVCCSFCGMQYRRITEVVEDDKKERPSGHSSSANAKKLKGNPNRGPIFVGPKTPAEADTADEDVTQFKRVHIVAAPDFSKPPAVSPLEPLAAPDLSTEISTSRRRPPLPAPSESISHSNSVISTDLVTDISNLSFSIPDDGSPITIRTNRLGLLPAPYDSLIDGISLGQPTLASLGDGISSRRVSVMVTRHDDRQHVTFRIVTEEEEIAFRDREQRGDSLISSRRSDSDRLPSSESSDFDLPLSVIAQYILEEDEGRFIPPTLEEDEGRFIPPTSDISSMPPDSMLDDPLFSPHR